MKEGDAFTPNDTICEVSLLPSDLMVGVNDTKPGIIAKTLAFVGKQYLVHEPIAIIVANLEEYNNFKEEERIAIKDSEVLAETSEIINEGKKKPDAKVLLREIKHLIQNGDIEESSGTSIHFYINKYTLNNLKNNF